MTPADDGRARLRAIRDGGKPALARALAEIEEKGGAVGTADLLDAALEGARGHVLGLTGPPGVGKSTLTDALVRACRERGWTVGVIAIDPSSRTSGGALLGDRTRMRRDPGDAGVFVRSMAARDRLGGIAELTFPTAVLMGAVMDVVIVETVGVGQSETAVADIADTVVFCAQPGAGDAIQFMKAGVLEIPDLVVVTKSDLGAIARRTVADMRGALSLMERGDEVPVLACSATTGEGIGPLTDALAARMETSGRAALAERRRAQALDWLGTAIRVEVGRIAFERLGAGEAPRDSAPFASARRLLDRIGRLLDAAPPG